MQARKVKFQPDGLTGCRGRIRGDLDHKSAAGHVEIDERGVAKLFDDPRGALKHALARSDNPDMFRAHADFHCGACRADMGAAGQDQIAALGFHGQKIHRRAADEACNKAVHRGVVQLERAADLLHNALVQDDDLVGQRHRLDLIVGDVDHRCLEVLMQLGQFQPHLDPQQCVKVRQRLVEQEHLRVTHQRPADGNPLPLSAGQL